MPRRRALGKWAVAALVAVATAVSPLAPTSAGATGAHRPPFYEPPANLPAHNGDVIRSEPAAFYLNPQKAAESGAQVDRIMYRTTDRTGEPVAVTGTVLTPTTPRRGPRPIIGYAPGTHGLADRCAPSRQMAEGTDSETLFVKRLLDEGYAVVVTDYQGLGTPGVHTYMNREVQGRALLDAVRAAQRLDAAHLPDSGPVALYGYSQGGGAAASAAELAHTYAPELKVKGAVVGAAPADLDEVAKSLDGTFYSVLVEYAFAGLAAGYGIDTAPYLNRHGQRVLSDLRNNRCTTEAVAGYAFLRSRSLTADGRSLPERNKLAPFDRIVAEQRLGERRPALPVLVSHSVLDDIIPHRVGARLAADWCRRGATVKFTSNHIPTHIAAAAGASAEGVPWLADRFAGETAPSTC
ncbi:lipase [Streptomyces ruber]|uniref:Lipase n=2 Tax=Streptomyces TaxID=1883 RepID=A0A918BC82_9ACTN|nr:lipase family protein [Streptomyces ruber]GGQ52676.1 lipase [Streptomyces ruber]